MSDREISHMSLKAFDEEAKQAEAHELLEQLCYLFFAHGPKVFYIDLGSTIGIYCRANDVEEAVRNVVKLARPELLNQEVELDKLRDAVRTLCPEWEELQQARRIAADNANEELDLMDQMEEA